MQNQVDELHDCHDDLGPLPCRLGEIHCVREAIFLSTIVELWTAIPGYDAIGSFGPMPAAESIVVIGHVGNFIDPRSIHRVDVVARIAIAIAFLAVWVWTERCNFVDGSYCQRPSHQESHGQKKVDHDRETWMNRPYSVPEDRNKDDKQAEPHRQGRLQLS